MAIAPIGAITQIAAPTTGTSAVSGTSVAGSDSSSFGSAISSSLDSLATATDNAQQLAQGVATGSANLGQYMVAANEANLDTGLTVAVRDKAVQAFNQIMGMQF